MASLFVTYPGDLKREVDQALAARLEPYLWHMLHLAPLQPGKLTPCWLNLMLPNVPVAREVQGWAKSVPGVVETRVELFERMAFLLETYDAELATRRAQVAPVVDVERPAEGVEAIDINPGKGARVDRRRRAS